MERGSGRRWEILSRFIKENDYRRMVEVGVKSGRNVWEICTRCPEVEIIAVDPWCGTDNYVHWSKKQVERHEREFDAVQAQFRDRVRKVKRFSVDAAPLVEDGSLDLVFIDGDHSYEAVKSDIAAWLPKVREGGIISGHDYGNTNQHGDRFAGVDRAVDEAFSNAVELYDDHVWAVRV